MGQTNMPAHATAHQPDVSSAQQHSPLSPDPPTPSPLRPLFPLQLCNDTLCAVCATGPNTCDVCQPEYSLDPDTNTCAQPPAAAEPAPTAVGSSTGPARGTIKSCPRVGWMPCVCRRSQSCMLGLGTRWRCTVVCCLGQPEQASLQGWLSALPPPAWLARLAVQGQYWLGWQNDGKPLCADCEQGGRRHRHNLWAHSWAEKCAALWCRCKAGVGMEPWVPSYTPPKWQCWLPCPHSPHMRRLSSRLQRLRSMRPICVRTLLLLEQPGKEQGWDVASRPF